MSYGHDLDQIRVLAVSGEDRVVFLQGQLTQDVGRASHVTTRLAGWADARGRLLWAGHLFARDNSLCLLVPAEIAGALATRLKLYVLRARVGLAIADLAVIGAGNAPEALPPLPVGWQPLQLAGDPGRTLLIGPASARAEVLHTAGLATLAPAQWQLADIRAGIPTIVAATSGAFVPQMVNLDLLDGISFSKGCYTGQEIVARTRYLGRVKRRMLRFATAGSPPPPGAAIYGEHDSIGQVVSAAPATDGVELLAVVRMAELTDPVFADGARTRMMRRQPLPYVVPEADAS